jgi:hypothetical protein
MPPSDHQRVKEAAQAYMAQIAGAIAQEIGREVAYREVEADGAARAAGRIGELL